MRSALRQSGMFLADIVYALVQLLSFPFGVFLQQYFRVTVYRPKNSTIPPGTLILANHQSRIDPLLISWNLGIRNIVAILPTRYPVASKYMHRPIIGTFLRLLGGYDVGATPLESAKKLLFTKGLLEHNRTVLLFPEGKIVRESDMREEFRRGAHLLFSKNFPVMFVRLVGFNTASLRHPHVSKKMHIHYSEVIQNSDVEYKVKEMERFFQEEDVCI